MDVHCCGIFSFCFCKQKTAYEMRISDWSSDVCSSDLAFSARLRVPSACRDLAVLHTGEHLLIHRVLELRPKTLLELLARMAAFRPGDRFEHVLRASLCDARDRQSVVEGEGGYIRVELGDGRIL